VQAVFQEQRYGRRQKTVAVVFGLFLAVMLLLTLFSNTLLAMTLPKVTTEQPRKAKLQQTIEGSGILVAKEEAELKNNNGLGVREVLVQEGDAVKKGQTLIVFDTTEAERQLQDEEARLRKQRLALEKAQDSYIVARQNGDEIAVREAERSLESGRLDIGMQERAISALRDKMAKQSKLAAPFEGIVTQLSADADLPPSPGQLLLRISNRDKGFKLEIDMAESSANLLKPGDPVPIRLEGEGGKALQAEGQVSDIAMAEQGGEGKGVSLAAGSGKEPGAGDRPRKKLVITVQGEQLQSGGRARLSVVKAADKETLLIPNGVIKEDAAGSFVYTVVENKGTLGNTFTVNKAYITKGEANDKETAVARGLSPGDRIVSESSEPLQDGNRVRLE